MPEADEVRRERPSQTPSAFGISPPPCDGRGETHDPDRNRAHLRRRVSENLGKQALPPRVAYALGVVHIDEGRAQKNPAASDPLQQRIGQFVAL